MNCRHCKEERSKHFYGKFCPNQDEDYINDWVNGNYSSLDGNENADVPDEFGAEWPKFLNVYEQNQGYGGGEEGGWWYYYGEPLESVRVDNQEQYDQIYKFLCERYEINSGGGYALKGNPDHPNYDRGRARGATSSAGGYDIVIHDEYEFAKPYPARTPRYE